MGVCRRFLLPEFKDIIKDMNTKNLDVVELGDQRLNQTDGYSNTVKFPGMRFRNLFKTQFNSWRCLDIQLNHDDVEYFDLSLPTDEKGTADIITNYGTTEHVEPDSGQYICWKNIHNMLRLGGIIISAIPKAGEWPKHCRWYYTFEFFENFKNYGYEIVHLEETWSKLVYCVLRKIEEKEFMSEEEFLDKITFVDNSLSNIPFDNNPKRLN